MNHSDSSVSARRTQNISFQFLSQACMQNISLTSRIFLCFSEKKATKRKKKDQFLLLEQKINHRDSSLSAQKTFLTSRNIFPFWWHQGNILSVCSLVNEYFLDVKKVFCVSSRKYILLCNEWTNTKKTFLTSSKYSLTSEQTLKIFPWCHQKNICS